jgi:hypothetical protein
MLEYLRKSADKPLAKVLMGVLIFSFVGWGVAGWIFGESRIDDSVLSVGRAPLKIQAFENEKSRALSGMPKESQKRIYSDKSEREAFSEQILSRMTSRMMLEQRAEDLGLSVSNAEVARIIKAEPAFQINGGFDLGRMNAALYYAQITEDQLAESIRADTLREMVLAGIRAGMAAPKFAAGAIYRARGATRDIEYASVKFSDFKVSDNPTDEQLRITYAKNPKIVPEARKVSYVLTQAKMDNPDSYDSGYKMAQKLEDALIGGEPMASAAKKLGAKFVALPALSAGETPADAIAAAADVFSMEQGVESQIIEAKDGFAIVRVDDVQPQHNAPFETMKKELVATWRADEQKKLAYEKANELLIQLNAGGELREGKSASVGRATGAPVEVLSAAFANPEESKTIVPGADAFHVLYVRKASAPKADEAKQAALAQEATLMLNRALADDYMAFLQREYPVKINQRVYKRLFGTNQPE